MTTTERVFQPTFDQQSTVPDLFQDAAPGRVLTTYAEVFAEASADADHTLVGLSRITPPSADQNKAECPNKVKVKLVCGAHGQWRIRFLPCRRRGCEVCGPQRLLEYQQRIAHGIRTEWPMAVLVGTFLKDESKCELHRGGKVWAECRSCKKYAVRQVEYFMRKLRRLMPGLAYSVTWEKHKSGVLHYNLVVGPWDNLPREAVGALWGRRIKPSWVRDEEQLANEVVKRDRGRTRKSVEGLAAYNVKISQQVQHGRQVGFSGNWPKMPKAEAHYEGEVTTHWLDDESRKQAAQLPNDLRLGWAVEDAPGIYANLGMMGLSSADDLCKCFHTKMDETLWATAFEPVHRWQHWQEPWKDSPKRLTVSGNRMTAWARQVRIRTAQGLKPPPLPRQQVTA